MDRYLEFHSLVLICLLVLLFSLNTLVFCSESIENQDSTVTLNKIFGIVKPKKKSFYTLQLQMGHNRLLSSEYVYTREEDLDGNSENLISELVWHSPSNLIFSISFILQKQKKLYMAQYSFSFDISQENYMYDYDWLYKRNKLQKTRSYDVATNYSVHKMKQALLSQALFRIGMEILEYQKNQIFWGYGFDLDFSAWHAYDGGLFYKFFDHKNQYNIKAEAYSGIAVSYSILLVSPHVFIHIDQDFDVLQWTFSVGFSPLTLWLARDLHYARELQFIDFGFLGQKLLYGLEFRWRLHSSLSLDISIRGSYLFRTIGFSMVNYDYEGFQLTTNSVGAKQQQVALLISFSYLF